MEGVHPNKSNDLNYRTHITLLGRMPITMLGPQPLIGRNHKGCILALHNCGTSITMGFHVTVCNDGIT